MSPKDRSEPEKKINIAKRKKDTEMKVREKYEVWEKLRELKSKKRDEELSCVPSSDTIMFWAISLFISISCFSTYALYFNISRERIEGNSRAYAHLCSDYLAFDLADVIEASYSFPASDWWIPASSRDQVLKEKACQLREARWKSHIARMGSTQSNNLH